MRLFDLHCDTLSVALHQLPSVLVEEDTVAPPWQGIFTPWIQTMAAWIPDALRGEAARQECFAQLALAREWERRYPEMFRVLDFHDPLADYPGCQVMLSVEGAGALGEDSTLPDRLAAKGVKLISFTWNGDNAWASGCSGTPDRGLTPTGQWMLRRLETLSITLDVSHLNEVGFWQVASISQRPLVASHSNAASIYPHPRNLTDDQFTAIRERGGLVGLNLYPGHLGELSCEQFQRHLEHFLRLGGERTLCIGSDLDGFTLPPDTTCPAILTAIWEHLTRQGYTHSLLEDIFYKNAQRFFFGINEQDKE